MSASLQRGDLNTAVHLGRGEYGISLSDIERNTGMRAPLPPRAPQTGCRFHRETFSLPSVGFSFCLRPACLGSALQRALQMEHGHL